MMRQIADTLDGSEETESPLRGICQTDQPLDVWQHEDVYLT
jgi:hypothetical protein